MQQLKSNELRGKYAVTLIWAVLVMEIAMLISSYFQYDLLQSFSNGELFSMEEAELNDSRELYVGITYMIIFAISSTTFIQWFRRAYFNLHQLVQPLSYSDGWAAGGWFVPIMNLFRPYTIMKELYAETNNLLTRNGMSIFKDNYSLLLGTWWTFWIINNILGQIVFRYSRHAESIDELINLTVISIISNLVGIPLALLAVKVVKDYSRVEPVLMEIAATQENELESEGE